MITWDERKRKKVIKDHGVDIAMIEDVFDDPDAVYLEDFAHSTDLETRLNVIGICAAYGLIFVTFVFSEDDDIRVVTARRAEKWMVSEYEKERKRL